MRKSCSVKIIFPKCFQLFPITIILNFFQMLLFESIINYYKNPFIHLLIVSIGQSFTIFIYLYNNKKKEEYSFYSENKKDLNEKINLRITKLYVLGLLVLCVLTDILGNIKYEYIIYSQKMKNILKARIQFLLEFIFFNNLICVVELNFLKIKIHRHHILGMGINSIFLFSSFIYYSFQIKEEFSLSIVVSFILIIIISFETQFLKIIYYIIPKKINFEYFINMNLISFIKGIIQFIFCLILEYFFSDKFKYQFSNKPYKLFNLLEILAQIHISLKILFILFYCIICCFQITYTLKIIEESRPSYNLIPIFFSLFFFRILESFYYIPFNIAIIMIISLTFQIIGTLIFCESIIVSYCNFDRNTIHIISKRSENEVINDLAHFEDESSVDN